MGYPTLPQYDGIPPQYQHSSWVADPAYSGGGYWAGYGLGQRYTEPELETLWINAGGSRQLAPVMAAIAYQVESGGYSGAWNSSGATGLWQIEWPSSAPSGMSRQALFDPANNARAAVRLSGNSMAGVNSNWAGDLAKIKTPGLNPSASLPPGTTFQTTATQTSSKLAPTCLLGVGGSIPIPTPLGTYHQSTGTWCMLSKSQARGVAGALLMATGGLIMLSGLILIGMKFSFGPAVKIATVVAGLTPEGGAAKAAAAGAAAASTAAESAPDNGGGNGETPATGTLADERGTSPEFREQFGTAS